MCNVCMCVSRDTVKRKRETAKGKKRQHCTSLQYCNELSQHSPGNSHAIHLDAVLSTHSTLHRSGTAKKFTSMSLRAFSARSKDLHARICRNKMHQPSYVMQSLTSKYEQARKNLYQQDTPALVHNAIFD